MTLSEKDIPSDEYLSQKIARSISILKPKVENQKRKIQFINGASIVTSACITLTLGFKATDYEIYQQNMALILGAFLTILNGWGAVFNYRKLWIRQKTTLLELYHLENYLHYKIHSKNLSDKDSIDIFERYQEIWERDCNDWRDIAKKSLPLKVNNSN
ncbi:SLATT domain-containing protein [Photobacterium leiognathi]|uniref:SLATT domain-containing protein n=1 Tax=Photobacterium leiognathi TaxID=553611 RepID=UPI002732CC37|nr:SLATT domain-containing protein [Photobacterium leiognathi]